MLSSKLAQYSVENKVFEFTLNEKVDSYTHTRTYVCYVVCHSKDTRDRRQLLLSSIFKATRKNE